MMFEIIFENETHAQWSSDFVFEDFDEAKDYLLDQGFLEKNRIFERKDYNWCKYLKAYITPKKAYKRYEILEIKEFDKALEVFVKDMHNRYFCFRYEDTILSNELTLLNRYQYNPVTKQRVYDWRRGLLNDKKIKIVEKLLNEVKPN
jgi:ribosomal protein L22